MKKTFPSQRGFSLTEMSVVMVIIAFIIAGVLKGDSLIKAARLRAVISEVGKYRVAVNSFNAKYSAYPGDFDEGAEYWTGSSSGDGNSKIEFLNTAGVPVYEGYMAWQHLAYTNMVDTPFLGTRTTGTAILSADIPKSKTDGGYFFEYGSYGLNDSNVLVLGTPVNIGVSDTDLRVDGNLTPAQAFEIDTKSDDGSPISGSVRGADGDSSAAEDCVKVNPDADPSTADDIYDILAEGEDCSLAFKITGQ